MPGTLVHVGATVICSHGGQAQPSAANQRVLVGGQPTVTMAAPYMVAACPFTTPGGPLPCVTGQWVVAATRVFSNGQPLVLQASQSVCVPTGTPLIVLVTQLRVVGT